jgi:hypothetical protein
MTTRLVLGCLLAAMTLFMAAAAAAADGRIYEMRVYYAAPGKLDDLHARFRDHTCKLFEKHGMENIGYWTPIDNAENKLIYVLAYPSKEAREKSWKEFMADPDWKAAQKASEANGRLVNKVDATFMAATDYSPAIAASKGDEARVFELRVYTTPPDKLGALHARFRDHTVDLFKKHGMTSFAYWTPVDEAKGAGHTLIYILAHKSHEAGLESFKNFRADPEWIKVKAASEANGSLTIPDGVKSTYMVPTDYSASR